MEEAERLCDRIGIIDAGTILAEGSRRELVAIVGEATRVTLDSPPGRHRSARCVDRTDEVTTSDDGGIGDVARDARTLSMIRDDHGKRSGTINSVEVAEPDLEHVFAPHRQGTPGSAAHNGMRAALDMAINWALKQRVR